SLPRASSARLAFAQTGCRDLDFIDQVVLRGELHAQSAFGGLISKLDVLGAVAATRDYKEADLVVAPVTAAPSLVEAIRVDGVPNPAFVAMNRGLDAALVADVKAAVLGAAGDEIEGWRAPLGYGAFAA